MIKAVYQDGVIRPIDPVPSDWRDGQELQIQQTTAPCMGAELRRRFDCLAAQWKEETRYLSSTTDIVTNPAYQRIIGMGMPAVPLILEELRSQPYHWFWALNAITGEDPVAQSLRGRVREMADAWIAWGAEKGLIGPKGEVSACTRP
jgi:predicted DNA-binding antitoxin AbrB/MazE fold protein